MRGSKVIPFNGLARYGVCYHLGPQLLLQSPCVALCSSQLRDTFNWFKLRVYAPSAGSFGKVVCVWEQRERNKAFGERIPPSAKEHCCLFSSYKFDIVIIAAKRKP